MGIKSNYNLEIYNMYEEEFNKNKKLECKIKELELEIHCLNSKLNVNNSEIEKEIENAIAPFKEENIQLRNELTAAYQEIDRLKSYIESNNNGDKDYIIDKLTNQLNKDSSNSGIPTSKEITTSKLKTRTNTYNHREKNFIKKRWTIWT